MIEAIHIPQVPELFTVRKQLGDLPDLIPDYPLGVPGINLVQKSDRRPKYEDCECFVFREILGVPPQQNPFRISRMLRENATPCGHEEGAIAYYYASHDDYLKDQHQHVGFVIDNTRMLSKWGMAGHIYTHLPFLVPLHYGNIIRYYKT